MELLRETELSAPARELFAEMESKREMELTAWQRIESFIGFRFAKRDVEFILQGKGVWEIPLRPAVVKSVEVWRGQWVQPYDEYLPDPLGLEFFYEGRFRVIAEIGGLTVPEYVKQAVIRLAEYLAESTENATMGSYSWKIGGELEESWSRGGNAQADALTRSGAADLLRQIRRIK